MKAVSIRNNAGPAEALFIDEIPSPDLTGDEILVQIRAFGINRMDTMQREGIYPMLPEYGNILGVEFSGIVEGKGPSASDTFKVGDKVFGLTLGGAYAEKVVTSEKTVIHMPAGLTWEEAASLPETFFTAVQTMTLVGKLKPGEDVLIHAGASGVGLSAIQVAKLFGAKKVFVTAGTNEKCQLCKSVGADFAINYRSEDFAEVIKRETNGRGVDIILDLVGAAYWSRNVESAALDARIVVIAYLSGSKIPDFDMSKVLGRRISILTTQLRSRGKDYQSNVRNIFRDKVLPRIASGDVKTIIDSVSSWRDIVQVHRKLDSNETAGKVVCKVD
ncbi:hypothetical protein F5884DRAFT_846699 [Xylogone sp. PMI_703]|nr:hypothetical protein F5884DRAFT_846699 [Xylogone sp. PMI_703]